MSKYSPTDISSLSGVFVALEVLATFAMCLVQGIRIVSVSFEYATVSIIPYFFNLQNYEDYFDWPNFSKCRFSVAPIGLSKSVPNCILGRHDFNV